MKLPTIPVDQSAATPNSLTARARDAAEVLQAVDLAAAVIDYNGNVLARTAGWDRLPPGILIENPAGFAFVDRRTQDTYTNALRLMRLDPGSSRTIAAPRQGDCPPAIAILSSLGGTDSFIVRITLLQTGGAMGDVLQKLFRLTPAEARIAQGIARGQTVSAMAGAFDVSQETIRTQLKSALSKAGLRRQIELAALIAPLLKLQPHASSSRALAELDRATSSPPPLKVGGRGS
jgi:DNA-binding CsgD family transcriptional regulator